MKHMIVQYPNMMAYDQSAKENKRKFECFEPMFITLLFS